MLQRRALTPLAFLLAGVLALHVEAQAQRGSNTGGSSRGSVGRSSPSRSAGSPSRSAPSRSISRPSSPSQSVSRPSSSSRSIGAAPSRTSGAPSSTSRGSSYQPSTSSRSPGSAVNSSTRSLETGRDLFSSGRSSTPSLGGNQPSPSSRSSSARSYDLSGSNLPSSTPTGPSWRARPPEVAGGNLEASSGSRAGSGSNLGAGTTRIETPRTTLRDTSSPNVVDLGSTGVQPRFRVPRMSGSPVPGLGSDAGNARGGTSAGNASRAPSGEVGNLFRDRTVTREDILRRYSGSGAGSDPLGRPSRTPALSDGRRDETGPANGGGPSIASERTRTLRGSAGPGAGNGGTNGGTNGASSGGNDGRSNAGGDVGRNGGGDATRAAGGSGLVGAAGGRRNADRGDDAGGGGNASPGGNASRGDRGSPNGAPRWRDLAPDQKVREVGNAPRYDFDGVRKARIGGEAISSVTSASYGIGVGISIGISTGCWDGYYDCWPGYWGWYGWDGCYGYGWGWGYPCYGWGWGWGFGWCWGAYWRYCGSWWWWSYPYHPAYYNYPSRYYTTIVYDNYVAEQPVQEEVVEEGPAGEADYSTTPETQSGLNRAADYYLVLGDRAFREGRYGDAVHYYAKAVEFSPDEGILYLILSDALFATGDYHYAAYALRKAAELDPGLFSNVVDKHSFYADPRDFDRQLAVLETYLQDHYVDGDARLVLAANYLFGGRPAAAVDVLESELSVGLRDGPAGKLILESARAIQYGAPVPAEGQR